MRDFEDPGQPLFYLVTAGAAALFGIPVLATNVVLCILLQAGAASCTYVLARRASGSPIAGTAAAIVAIVSSPRLYNTTKIIVPVVTILFQWRYADMPNRRRLVALGAWTAIAFLLRHDYALYVVASTIILLAVRHSSDLREATNRVAIYGGVVVIVASPWLAYVQWNEGLGEYASAALRFAASEGRRTAAGPPQALYYLLALLPLCGLVVAFARTRTLTAAHLASTSVLVLMMNAVFLRDVLLTRLPDVIAPTVILAAAMIGQMFHAKALRVGALIVCATTIVFATTSLAVAGYRIPTPMAFVRQTGRVTERLLNDSPDIQPSPRHAALVSYLARCTPPRERVFVTGFGPQIPFLAGRPFAGGPAVVDAWLLRRAGRHGACAAAPRSGTGVRRSAAGRSRRVRARVARSRGMVPLATVRGARPSARQRHRSRVAPGGGARNADRFGDRSAMSRAIIWSVQHRALILLLAAASLLRLTARRPGRSVVLA